MQTNIDYSYLTTDELISLVSTMSGQNSLVDELTIRLENVRNMVEDLLEIKSVNLNCPKCRAEITAFYDLEINQLRLTGSICNQERLIPDAILHEVQKLNYK